MSLVYRVGLGTESGPFSSASDREFIWTVPSEEVLEVGGYLWLRTISFQYTSSSAGGDRTIAIRVRDKSGLQVVSSPLTSPIVADEIATITYGGTSFPYRATVGGGSGPLETLIQGALERVHLLEGDQVRIQIFDAQAGDLFSQPITVGLNRIFT